MPRHPFDITADMLPQSLPIFPLEGTLLLPGGQVPLNITELRYINMVQDALAARDRMIGIAIPTASASKMSNKPQPTYTAGCAGKITAFEETADGRFLVTLTGYSRFRIVKDIPTLRSYRRAEVNWSAYEKDLHIDPNPEIDREGLLDSLKEFLPLIPVEMDWHAIEHTPNFTLVNFFAMSLPFSDDERQKLLEATDTPTRAVLLDALVHRAIERKKRQPS